MKAIHLTNNCKNDYWYCFASFSGGHMNYTVNSEHIRSSNHRICHTTTTVSLYIYLSLFLRYWFAFWWFVQRKKIKTSTLTDWLTSEQLNLTQVKIQTTILAASTISTKQRWIWCVQCFLKDVLKLRCRWSSLFYPPRRQLYVSHLYHTAVTVCHPPPHHAYFYKTKFHRSYYESRVKS